EDARVVGIAPGAHVDTAGRDHEPLLRRRAGPARFLRGGRRSGDERARKADNCMPPFHPACPLLPAPSLQFGETTLTLVRLSPLSYWYSVRTLLLTVPLRSTFTSRPRAS